jgi:hypothetical protein
MRWFSKRVRLLCEEPLGVSDSTDMMPGALLAPQGAHAPHQDLGLGRVESASESTTALPTVPGEWLDALAVRVKLHRLEWRVLALTLSAPSPVSASAIAKRLGVDYGLVKRVVRELARWNILERVPTGVKFQPDHTRWGPPRVPSTT